MEGKGGRMYRLLKDLLNWKVSLYIKLRLGRRCQASNVAMSMSVFLFISLLCIVDCSSASDDKNIQSNLVRNSEFRRTLDHGIFRHDDNPFPPRSDVGNVETNVGVGGSSSSSSSSSPDHRDRYNSYDRFKRSVNSLNFHPKPRNESKTVGLKPMRIFKYVTEDDVITSPTHENRHNPHITVFHPLVNMGKNETEDKEQRIVGGAKINLKAKLDKKVISANEANKNNNNESDSELKRKSNASSSSSPSTASSSKPENILIFKPSLAIRKNGSAKNKTSLIPSGKYTKPEDKHKHKNNDEEEEELQVGKPTNIDADTRGSKITTRLSEPESTDPNSSTVNDRSLIQPNLYFDSVVMLSEEGQKHLKEHQNTNAKHREEEAKDDEQKSDDDHDDADAVDEEDKVAPSSSSSKKNDKKKTNNNKNADSKKKISSPSLNTNTSEKNGNATTSSTSTSNSTGEGGGGGGLSEKNKIKWNKKMNAMNTNVTKITSEGKGNKDKVIYKVVSKSKWSKDIKSYSNKTLNEDDGDIDEDRSESERSRRSPLKFPMNFQQNGQPLARAALFRTNHGGVTRLRTIPVIKKKVMPRLISPLPGRMSIRKNPGIHRAIVPMKPIPMQMANAPMRNKVPNLALVPGPVGPGPVGPPIAAIKVTHLNLNNMKTDLSNNKNNMNVNTGPSASSNLVPNVIPSGNMVMGMNSRPGLDLTADASRTALTFKPLPDDVLLNHAASSYYSPTYKKFRKKFQNQISSIMDAERQIMETQRELEEGGLSRWEESRYPSSRHHSSHKSRHRTSGRSHHRRHPHRYDPHSHSHRSGSQGQHSQLPRHRPPSRGKKLPGAKYTYPKNAENIQDILKYFDDKGAPPPSTHRGGERSESSDKSSYSSKKHHNNHNHHRSHHRHSHSASALPAGNAHEREREREHEPSLPIHPKLADLSGEFRDVHASLLKDIKEFAKRPHLFRPGSGSGSTVGGDHADSKIHSIDSNEGGTGFFDPIDEIFGPKSKPVRDLIKPDLYSLENIRERIALKRGKLGGRPKDKDIKAITWDDHRHSVGDEHRNSFGGGDEHRGNFHHENYDGDDFYDSQRPSRHNSRDDPRSGEHLKNSVFNSKEDYDTHSQYLKRNRHKEGGIADDPHTIFPSSHFDSSSSSKKDSEKDYPVPNPNPYEYQSGEYPPTKAPFTRDHRKPVVLKRPHTEPFRYKEAQPKPKKPDHDFFWNSFQTGFEKPASHSHPPKVTSYEPPLVIKSPSPSVLHPYTPYSHTHFGPAQAASHALPKPVSVEDEDIVEIHTGHPHSHPLHTPTVHTPATIINFPTPAPHHDPMKQEKLKKMYMDVLQQKMQIEAALMQPQAAPMIPQPQPLQYNHHQPGMTSMHTSASLLPSHNPLPMHRVPQQMSYPVTPVTLSPLTSLVQRRKKPMRMKIHIYPNGHDGLEQGIEAANLLAAGGFGTSGFSASNPPGVVAPPPPTKDMSASNKVQESAMPSGPTGGPGSLLPPTNPSGFSGSSSMTGPTAPVNIPVPSKNKNVVLHLHVHRRNDMLGPLELETEGSNPVPQTASKPISFKEMFDEQLKSEEEDRERKSNLANHRMEVDEPEPGPGSHSNSVQDETRERDQEQDTHDNEEDSSRHHHDHHNEERDKSTSMEVPIHDEKIEDVFHTIMKLRKKVDNRKKRS